MSGETNYFHKEAIKERRFQRLLLPFWGMSRIAHLQAFLPEAQTLVSPILGLWSRQCTKTPVGFDAVAGWGRKATSIRARAIAQKYGLAYLAIEDGFLRSFGLGVDGAPPYSLVVDTRGIYYDSTQESDLEHMLAHGQFDAALLERAQIAMGWLRHEKLTKYNQPMVAYDGPRIRRLIVDQTAGDASVLLSGADSDAFARMVDDALHECGNGRVAIKLHPDTLKGRKKGYLRELARQRGVVLIDQPVDSWQLLAQCDEVATISSQMGFDALIAGCKVICYGLPFYAGWGVTEDKISSPRRTRRRSVTEIFAAAYLRYARYVDPFTGRAAELEDIIAILSDRCRHARRQSEMTRAVAIGFSPWKRMFLRKFMGAGITFCLDVPRDAARPILSWGLKRGDLPQGSIRIEDGFVRSRGLGAKLVRPWSLVADTRGIYFDPRQPSDLEYILQNAEMPEGLLLRARKLRTLMVEREISKYNVGTADVSLPIPAGKRIVLVPGQVEDDASIRVGTVEGLCRNIDLLRAARVAEPDAFVIYKPHPDVEVGKREGAIAEGEAKAYCDLILRDVSIGVLWPKIDAIHTLTSLSGFEALLRGKETYVYGKPFYAGWGLTHDREKIPRRTRHLTIDQLVAGTLVLYPLYYDWQTGCSCSIETVIHRLSHSSR